MKIKLGDTKYFNEVKKTHKLQIGTFYFFNKFIVAEINEGENVNWGNCQQIINLALDYYPVNSKVNYISNRVHDYSVSPVDWLKFFKKINGIENYYVVCCSKSSFLNFQFEKLFFVNNMFQTNSLQAAITTCLEQEKNQFTNT
jgi:hypothetical protein